MQQVTSSFAGEGAAIVWLLAAGSIVLAAIALRLRFLLRRGEEERANQRDLIENLHEGIYRSTLCGRQLSANRALVRLNGYDSEAEMLAAVGDIAREWYVLPGRREEFGTLLHRDGFVEDFVSEVFRHRTRERIWISESARLVRHRRTGRPLFYEGSVREITATVNRLSAEERLRKLSSQVPGGLIQFVCHADGSCTVPFVSRGFRAIYGIGEDEDLPPPAALTAMVHARDRQAYLDNVRAATRAGGSWDQEYRITLRNGTAKWLQINAKAEPVEDSVVWHGYISDITARKKTETRIEKLAFIDPLTGLPNRRMFMDRMASALAACRERGTSGALVFIDLDNFKSLNDTRGHDVGDAFLVEVAKRLKACVRPQDTVARIGGDEFVVILHEAGRDDAAATRAAILAGNRVLSAMREDFILDTFRHRASASIGAVVFDGASTSTDDVLKHADTAMYQVKAAGRDGMAIYDPATMGEAAAAAGAGRKGRPRCRRHA